MPRMKVKLVLFAVFLASTQAPQAPPAPAPRPSQQPLVPIAASTLTVTPDAYIGRTVTLTAPVEQRFGNTAFSVDQNPASSGPDVLILAPLLNAPVEPNGYVTVIGEVVRFDPADAAARMKDAMPVL